MTSAPAFGAISFPRGPWIPNTDQLTDSAAGLLAMIGQALDNYDEGEVFKRRTWSHGDLVPLQIPENAIGQLLISFGSLELGNAGEKQFQFQKGDIGAHVHMVGEFKIQLWIPWPTPTGGLDAYLADDADLRAASEQLNRVTWITFSALRSLSFGGVKINPPVTPIQQDQIIIGPAQPVGPAGGMAGMTIDVQLSYD